MQELLQRYFRGFDLSQIEVHDGLPPWVRDGVGAITLGNDIYFAPGTYDPGSVEGIALIGHEITHSVQRAMQGRWEFYRDYLGDYVEERLNGVPDWQAYRSIDAEQEAYAKQEYIANDLRSIFGDKNPCEGRCE